MAITLIFELTLDYEVIMPLMLACVVAYHGGAQLQSAWNLQRSIAEKGPMGV